MTTGGAMQRASVSVCIVSWVSVTPVFQGTSNNLPSGQQDPWLGLHQLVSPQSSLVPFQEKIQDNRATVE